MDQPDFNGDFLRASRVAMIGMGLMGGSLAMALKGKCAERVGIDPNPDVVAEAVECGVVERATSDLVQGLAGADLIVLAAPVRAILSILERLPELCDEGAVVIDLGSTKAQIAEAMNRLPERFEAVAGHPMCGKEKSSLQFAEAGLYQNAPFALVATERTTERARNMAQALVKAVGARALWIEAEEHDRWVAATSHTPFLLSSALALATGEEARPMVGPGFRGAARLAASSPEMMVDILATNRANVLAAVGAIREQLQELESLLAADDFNALASVFSQGALRYKTLTES